MRGPTLALIHSALVGPSSWSGVATELAAAGVPVVTPDLRDAAEKGGSVDAVIAAASGQLPDTALVLVGHSGAGMLLPAIAMALPEPTAAYVFVDAHVPQDTGEIPIVGADFLQTLTGLAVDGYLPPWSGWWGPRAMEHLVPNESLRAALSAEMPRLPLRYFSGTVAVPPGWMQRPCGYVRLSELYEPSAAEAQERGWPTVRFTAGHLHAAVDPPAVANAILDVVQISIGP